jgi:hypothetical protein
MNPTKIIVQSNVITMSRQSWTLLEKKVLYVIMSQLWEYRRLNEDIDMNSDIFMKFDGKILLKADKHITRVCKTLKSLREKSMEIRNNKNYIVVGLINFADYNTKTHEVMLQVSHKILPYYLNLTERFSRFALTTALMCKSVYSQRLFEICAMFSACGLFVLNIEQIRELFCIQESKYTSNKKDLIRCVVKTPQVELLDLYNNNLSELFFTFFEKNSDITFLVHQRTKPIRSSIAWAKMIAVLLTNVLDYNQSVIDGILIKYSTKYTKTDFSELFRELAKVKIHTKSKSKQRSKMAKILFAHSIHPNQNNSLF